VDSLDSTVITNRYSKKDINYLLSKLINSFGASDSFKESTDLRKKILALKKYISRDHVITIIEKTIQNSQDHPCHQITEAGGASFFYQEIYKLYKEPTTDWKKFARFISEDLSKRKRIDLLPDYNWLFQEFDMTSYARPDEEEFIDLDDIPF
jgi:hypothetical protein